MNEDRDKPYGEILDEMDHQAKYQPATNEELIRRNSMTPIKTGAIIALLPHNVFHHADVYHLDHVWIFVCGNEYRGEDLANVHIAVDMENHEVFDKGSPPHYIVVAHYRSVEQLKPFHSGWVIGQLAS